MIYEISDVMVSFNKQLSNQGMQSSNPQDIKKQSGQKLKNISISFYQKQSTQLIQSKALLFTMIFDDQSPYSNKDKKYRFIIKKKSNQKDSHKIILRVNKLQNNHKSSQSTYKSSQLNHKQSYLNQLKNKPFCQGEINLTNIKSENTSVTVFDYEQKKFVVDFLKCRIKKVSLSEIDEYKKRTLEIYLFSIKILIKHTIQQKRAFITINELESNDKQDQKLLKNVNNQQTVIQSSNIQPYRQKTRIKKLPIRKIQKQWIWYKDVFQFDFFNPIKQNKTKYWQINLFTYDFQNGFKKHIASYKGPLYVDFDSSDQIKFTQIQITDPINDNDLIIASMEFKYCLKNDKNFKVVSQMTSNIYRQNAISPAKLRLNNFSFIKNSSFSKDQLNLQNNLSTIKSQQNSHSLSMSRNSRNFLDKSRYHSIITSNNSIPMSNQKRFFSPKKKLTDQLGYLAHKSIAIYELPKTERYKYSSFGKGIKQCLNPRSFIKDGPGSARYRLPSIFDKY